MNEIKIHYTTGDEYVVGYAKAIRAAKSCEELVKAILPYKRAADDALKDAQSLSEKGFQDFRRDIKKAAKEGQPQSFLREFERRFGNIAMPRKMIFATIFSDEYHLPWGAAFIRCEETGWPMLK